MNQVIEETKQREASEDKLNMWKHSKLFNCKWLFMQIIALSISLNEAAPCTDCSHSILGTESKNIKYGPSNEHNCNCDWTIPTSMDTNHETAVVLLLQNVSLPRTIGTGSTECSGAIRFPSTDSHRCDFARNNCFASATASTICNINKIREKIPVANHTCDSIIPWNEAGGSPYEIRYYAKNFAGYTKYFTIQYLVIDCRSSTTTPKPATTMQQKQTTKVPLTLARIICETTTFETAKTTEMATNTKQTASDKKCIENSDSTSLTMIAVGAASGLIVGIIIGVLTTCLMQRFLRKKKLKNSMKTQSSQQHQYNAMKNAAYENHEPASNENGYEVIIPVDNKNERPYEEIKCGKESEYEK
ncbi:uncharacterized protein LOC144429793 [Styela clava]